MPDVTRFAPSPTGYLHLGHARAALFAASRADGSENFIVRIEDIDTGRCRREFEAAIFEDLAWLGLPWRQPVRRQSEHFADYRADLEALAARHLLYPCFCTRAEIAREVAAADAAPHGPDGSLYPGTCRRLGPDERARRLAAGLPHAWRLDTAAALSETGPLTWHDHGRGAQTATPALFGDVVLGRKDAPVSYHLACVHDDALQGVSLVTRGDDLFAATHVQRLLQALLGLPTPVYDHHPLIVDHGGRKLSKRDSAPTLRALRASGATPDQVRAQALEGLAPSA
jgi:glutamyl-Q tRNA(Asp) synthetase